MFCLSPKRASGFVLAACFVATAWAGCAGAADSSDTKATSRAPAPPPLAEAEFGSITGTIVDAETRPLPGARVAVVEIEVETKADDAGVFTFNRVEPREYTLVVERVGFSQVAKKVNVVAGKVTEVSFVLTSLVIEPEGYLRVRALRTVVEVGHTFIENRVPVWATYCKQCDHYMRIEPNPNEVLYEVTFTNGVSGLPMEQIWFDFRRNWTNDTTTQPIADGTSLGSGYLNDRARWPMGDAAVASLKTFKVDMVWLHVTGGAYTPSINKRIESYVTYAYHQAIPEEYSALPPK